MAEGSIKSDLTSLIRQGRLVPLVGAGVSQAVSQCPTWHGLVASGIKHALAQRLVSEETAKLWTDSLDAKRNAQELIELAQDLQAAMGGRGSSEITIWLRSQLERRREQAKDLKLINAIYGLQSPTIATTNLDNLLSICAPHYMEPVPWTEPARMLIGLSSGDKVLHLHGVWDRADSVVLGVEDYQELADAEPYRSILRALWIERTLLFIGCSVDGLSDPDLGSLLDWASATFKGGDVRHYALMRTGTVTTEQQRALLLDKRVQVVEYGTDHAQLPTWLEGLAPPPTATFLPPRRRLVGRETEVAQAYEAVVEGRGVLVSGMGGVGKTAVCLEVAHRVLESRALNPVVWLNELDRFSSLASFSDQMAAHTGALRLIGLPDNQRQAELSTHLSDWPGLVVLDDLNPADSASLFVRTYYPTGSPLLASSRRRSAGFERIIVLKTLARKSSVELLSFELGTEEAPGAFDAIAAALGDHPLALVLASARCRIESMPQATLLSRIQDASTRLETLEVTELPGVPPSVKSSIQLSFDDLPSPLFDAFLTIASSFGGLSLRTLADALGTTLSTTEDSVGQLASRSLVDWTGEVADMHPLLRDWGQQRLGSQLPERRRSLSRAIANSILTGTVAPNPAILVSDIASLRSIIDFVASQDFELRRIGLQALLRVSQPHSELDLLGRHLDAAELAERALTLATSLNEAEGVFAARAFHAYAIAQLGQRREAEAALQALLGSDVFEASSVSLDLLASTKTTLANLLLDAGKIIEATRLLEEVRTIAISLKNDVALASATGQLGACAWRQGNLPLTKVRYEEALALYRKHGHAQGSAACLFQLAKVAERTNDREASNRWHRESLDLEREAGNGRGVLISLNTLSELDEDSSQYDALKNELLAMLNDPRFEGMRGSIYHAAGDHGLHHGRLEDARNYYLQSLGAEERSRSAKAHAVTLGQLAFAEARLNDLEAAQSHILAARKLYAEIDDESGMATCDLQLVDLLEDGKPLEAWELLWSAAVGFSKARDQMGLEATLLLLKSLPSDPMDVELPEGSPSPLPAPSSPFR